MLNRPVLDALDEIFLLFPSEWRGIGGIDGLGLCHDGGRKWKFFFTGYSDRAYSSSKTTMKTVGLTGRRLATLFLEHSLLIL
jgi:hypothetical protein